MMVRSSDNATACGDLNIRISRVAAPLRAQVLQALRDAILDFRFEPGQRLVERDLIEQTGVSRTTVREVLRELEAEGLVETVPQKGAFVVSLTPGQLDETLEVRAALEEISVSKLVETAAPDVLERLRLSAHDLECTVAKGGDVSSILRSEAAFFDALDAGAGNETMAKILRGLRAQLRIVRAAALTKPGAQSQALDAVRALIDAAEAGNKDDAVASVNALLRQADARSGAPRHAATGDAHWRA